MIETFDALWRHVIDVVTLQFVSPWWSYLFDGVLIAGTAILLAWFFPTLRSFCGAVVMSVVSALWLSRRLVDEEARRKPLLRDKTDSTKPGRRSPSWWPDWNG